MYQQCIRMDGNRVQCREYFDESTMCSGARASQPQAMQSCTETRDAHAINGCNVRWGLISRFTFCPSSFRARPNVSRCLTRPSRRGPDVSTRENASRICCVFVGRATSFGACARHARKRLSMDPPRHVRLNRERLCFVGIGHVSKWGLHTRAPCCIGQECWTTIQAGRWHRFGWIGLTADA